MAQLLLISDPRPLVEQLGLSFFHQLSERPGVYLMRDAQEKILYIGKAKNLRKRLNNYRIANPDRMPRRHLRMLRQVARIELQECADEITALAKEAELLRALKPKFNRAGVWPGKARFLAWHRHEEKITFVITETPEAGWNTFGPFGSNAIYLRSAILRLLWYALNPETGSRTIPEGWLHGRIGKVGTFSIISKSYASAIENLLIRLFEGDAEGFDAWIKAQSQPALSAFDQQIVESDLESILEFLKTKTPRSLSLAKLSADVIADGPNHFENAFWLVQEDEAIG